MLLVVLETHVRLQHRVAKKHGTGYQLGLGGEMGEDKEGEDEEKRQVVQVFYIHFCLLGIIQI